MTSFSSNFAQPLEDFIREKRAVGYVYETAQRKLQAFDRFCREYYPTQTQLTRSVAMHWAQQRPDEHVNTLIHRIPPLRQFAKYLNRLGVDAYVIPSRVLPKGVRYIPHIYTQEELKTFFRALDGCRYDRCSPVRHLVLPVIFRVLYCCGLRSSEALGLRVENLDLTTGKLTILQSKGYKDRVVMLSEDVVHLCRIYDQKVRCALLNRTHFFPNPQGHRYSKGFLERTFHEFWDKSGLHVRGNRPRVHDFRYPHLNKIRTFPREYNSHGKFKEKGSDKNHFFIGRTPQSEDRPPSVPRHFLGAVLSFSSSSVANAFASCSVVMSK